LKLWHRMKREFGVLANVGAPQVAYKESIKQEAEVKENTFDNPEARSIWSLLARI